MSRILAKLFSVSAAAALLTVAVSAEVTTSDGGIVNGWGNIAIGVILMGVAVVIYIWANKNEKINNMQSQKKKPGKVTVKKVHKK